MKSITLKAANVKETISVQFGEKILSEGFSYKKAGNEFRRQNESYTYIFNIDQAAWIDSYSLHVRLYISQKQIEDTLEKIIGKLRHKLTIGNDIGRIYKSPDGREIVNGDLSIWIRQDEDVKAAIESLEWYYTDIAKPYFKRYQTLESIDDIINNAPFDHCPANVGGNFDERCMKGLIAARLVNNPVYEKLVAIYDEAIKQTMNNESIENYYKVKDYLMYNRIK